MLIVSEDGKIAETSYSAAYTTKLYLSLRPPVTYLAVQATFSEDLIASSFFISSVFPVAVQVPSQESVVRRNSGVDACSASHPRARQDGEGHAPARHPWCLLF